LPELFEVIECRDGLFHFRLSGFLDEEAVAEHGAAISHAYQAAVDSFAGEPFIVLADLRRLRTLPKAGEDLVRALMRYGRTRNLFWSINISPSALTRAGLKDAAQMTDTARLRSVVETPAQALALLEEKRREMEGRQGAAAPLRQHLRQEVS